MYTCFGDRVIRFTRSAIIVGTKLHLDLPAVFNITLEEDSKLLDHRQTNNCTELFLITLGRVFKDILLKINKMKTC